MADAVERLRRWADWPEHPGTNQDLRDAATEIETLRARLSQAGAGGVVDARQIAERVAGLVSLNKEAFAVEKAILAALGRPRGMPSSRIATTRDQALQGSGGARPACDRPRRCRRAG